jgi:hypothetical protein
MRSWYTDAIIQQVYPLLQSGEFGSQEELAVLLMNDDIFHQPGVFVSALKSFLHSELTNPSSRTMVFYLVAGSYF